MRVVRGLQWKVGLPLRTAVKRLPRVLPPPLRGPARILIRDVSMVRRSVPIAAPPMGHQPVWHPPPVPAQTLPAANGPPSGGPRPSYGPHEHGGIRVTGFMITGFTAFNGQHVGSRTRHHRLPMDQRPGAPESSSEPGAGGGTQHQSGTGEVTVAVLRRPVSWSITKEAVTRVDRNISDKPSFSPD